MPTVVVRRMVGLEVGVRAQPLEQVLRRQRLAVREPLQDANSSDGAADMSGKHAQQHTS